MPLFFSGQGVNTDLQGNVTNVVTLQAGQVYPLPNQWLEIRTGKYTTIQEYDPITTIWRSIGGGTGSGSLERIKADGNNYRLANQTGCLVGVNLTTAGAGYTSAPVVTATTGSAVLKAIVGGAVAASPTVTNGGTGYTYPPLVLISPPPSPGVQATAYCTLSGSAVSTVTITDQGAGYTAPPTITFVNDPREGQNGVTQGSGAAAVATLTGSGTITAVLVLDHGTPLTSAPSITFTGGGYTSTAVGGPIMCWTITAITVSVSGSGYAAPVIISAYDSALAASIYTNPTTQSALVKGRNAFIVGAVSSAQLTATGTVVKDGGIYYGTPNLFAYGFIPGAGATVATMAGTMGGTSDTSIILTT